MSKRVQGVIREKWAAKMDAEVQKRYWFAVKTEWDVTQGTQGGYVTTSVSGEQIPAEALAFIRGYSKGIIDAMAWATL